MNASNFNGGGQDNMEVDLSMDNYEIDGLGLGLSGIWALQSSECMVKERGSRS